MGVTERSGLEPLRGGWADAPSKVLRTGEFAYLQGDVATSLYAIESGRVAIEVVAADGTASVLGVLGPGELFGEEALLAGRRRRKSAAVARNDVRLRVLAPHLLDEVRRTDSTLDRMLLEVFADQVGRLSMQLVESRHAAADVRVFRRLLDVIPIFVSADQRGPIEVQITQSELASMAGVTRQTANQALRRGQDDGVVSMRWGRVLVPDVTRLETYTQDLEWAA